MGQLDKTPKIFVGVPGVRPRFELWIATRGGVQVWENVNLSDPGKDHIFTPALEEVTGINNRKKTIPFRKPRWSVARGEVVTDINRFEFVKAWTEVKRFHVAMRPGSQGLSMKLTDASTAKVRKYIEKHPEVFYRFDFETQECVFETPEME